MEADHGDSAAKVQHQQLLQRMLAASDSAAFDARAAKVGRRVHRQRLLDAVLDSAVTVVPQGRAAELLASPVPRTRVPPLRQSLSPRGGPATRRSPAAERGPYDEAKYVNENYLEGFSAQDYQEFAPDFDRLVRDCAQSDYSPSLAAPGQHDADIAPAFQEAVHLSGSRVRRSTVSSASDISSDTSAAGSPPRHGSDALAVSPQFLQARQSANARPTLSPRGDSSSSEEGIAPAFEKLLDATPALRHSRQHAPTPVQDLAPAFEDTVQSASRLAPRASSQQRRQHASGFTSRIDDTETSSSDDDDDSAIHARPAARTPQTAGRTPFRGTPLRSPVPRHRVIAAAAALKHDSPWVSGVAGRQVGGLDVAAEVAWLRRSTELLEEQETADVRAHALVVAALHQAMQQGQEHHDAALVGMKKRLRDVDEALETLHDTDL
jgi:hypothetical protein